jgi:hypothetical protein
MKKVAITKYLVSKIKPLYKKRDLLYFKLYPNEKIEDDDMMNEDAVDADIEESDEGDISE